MAIYANESAFIQAMHRRLDKRIYKLKINLVNNRGVFDCYYSGPGGDCWVEYKYLRNNPKNHFNPKRYLSELQQIWGAARQREGRIVFVLIGLPYGVILLRDLQRVPTCVFVKRQVPIDKAAEFIESICL